MPWTLEIWNPTRTQRLRTLSSDTATELDGGFRWQLDQYGDCRQWEATGRNDRLGIPPRAVIRFSVDGTPWFHGVIVDPPSVTSPDAEALTALGGREILAAALMDGAVYRNRGVYQIARDVLARLCPPALTYDATQIGDGSGTDAGPGLDTFYSPTATLADVMEALAKAAGVPCGVDVLGRPFLGRPAAAPLAVPYAGQPWRRLTVQGREACTQAVLRVVSAPSGPTPDERRTFRAGAWVDYLPATITKTATHALHGTYRAQRAIEPPDGAPLVMSGTRSLGGVYRFSSPAAAIDGDPDTYAESQSRDGVDLPALYVTNHTAQRPVGVRVRYSVQGRQDADKVRLFVEHFGGDVSDRAVFDLPNDQYIREQTIIFPPSPQTAATYRQLTVQFRLDRDVYQPSDVFGAGVIRVYDVQPLVVNEAAAQRTAESYLQVPYAAPAEIALDRLVPPTATVTVTGSPDGDVTGPAAQFEYTHLPLQPRRTVVKLGATGQSAAARELRFGGVR